MKQKFTRVGGTVIASAAVIGLTMLGAVGAQAAPAGYGDIDPGASSSITIHKYLHQSDPTDHDPSEADVAGLTDPVQGVEFTVYPLLQGGNALDMTDPASWDGLDQLSAGATCDAPTGYTLGTGVAITTDADGVASQTFPQGLYLVCETDVSGALVGGEAANIVDQQDPFIVTLPFPYADGWVYNVHSYPKNGKTNDLEKTIEDQQDNGLPIGSPVVFPVTATIPNLGTDNWTGYGIQDVFDSKLTVGSPAVASVVLGGTTLTEGTDYDVLVDGQDVRVSFLPAGLALLNGPGATNTNPYAGEELVVTFNTVVNEVGEIKNTAQEWVNNPTFDPDGNPPNPSNTVETNWGDLVVQKVDSSDPGATLTGAEFELYEAAVPYPENGVCEATPAGSALTINGNSVFTSGSDGTVTIDGVFVGDSVNYQPGDAATERCYVLVETKAPAGYVVPTNPNTAVTVAVGSTSAVDVTVPNTQQTVPGLPLTGGAGQLLLGIGGLLLLAVGAGLVVLKHRKAAHTE